MKSRRYESTGYIRRDVSEMDHRIAKLDQTIRLERKKIHEAAKVVSVSDLLAQV